MKTGYDIIVIGAGSGGLGVGIGMAQFGFKVLMIDKDKDNFGGECLNSGCIPSKALIHVTDILKKASDSEAYGYTLSGKPDIRRVLDYVHSRQEIIRKHESADYLKKEEGIDVLIGQASFSGRNAVEVNGQEYQAKKILVATGSKPRRIQVEGMERMKIFTNENLFHIDFIPENFLVIGGGPIGLEMSQCFARLGSKVTVLEKNDRILKKELPEVSALLQQQLEKEDIDFRLGQELVAFRNGRTAVLKNQEGKEIEIPCDAVLVGIGRDIPYDTLQLEKAGVKMDREKDWPLIDNYLRAKGNRNIVFAGDAAHNVLFSHGAELHTTILLNNFFIPWPFKQKFNLDNFSWCTFTDPQVATFGLSKEEMEKRSLPYEVVDFKLEGDDRAIASDYRYGHVILFLKKSRWKPRNGKVLGGTIVAPNAGEMVQELIMAKQQGLGAGAIFNKIYPYPTQTRAHKIALVEKFSGGISPGIRNILRFLYH
ncbi:MAG TPA: mercuric reductase [Cryomorphaceae bacterium]|nr:mercuric reductase [Owenweeksia sp.]HAD96409.1 mercuric reductase [Cryomorphaceae bacterium]HBF21735.1 mercuric reductase [Cryomorphaceae bacterium]HCQ16114.1 mercuric reductase [Cryomorphaceae bacterium]|tara:strand:+ start:22995 stop:24440 length:1446 start_codon:yes stop_codon:yes gene_type:complete